MSETPGISRFLDGRVTLHAGDCRDVLKTLADCSIDSIVTDPPYALVSIGKRFGKDGSAPAKSDGATGVYNRAAAGFMGQQWDTGETAFAVEFWREALRVLKPGGHVVAFSGTRTYHRIACAIEDAGFEIRDQLAWAYGSGFPKSHNQKDDWEGWGTALKPAWEPIAFARKSLVGTVAANVAAHGTGAINIDGCRIHGDDAQGGDYVVKRLKPGATLEKTGGNWRPDEGGELYHGALKPGRWPANILHDGSDEVVALFPLDSGGRTIESTANERGTRPGGFADIGAVSGSNRPNGATYTDFGSAARFFYAAKADADDRIGSKHPTVKPVDLMQWLVRLITPPGGTVLDPFAGTGTTGEAAWREGFSAVLVEREADFCVDIARRMELALAGPATRNAAIAKARPKRAEALPLFSDEPLGGGAGGSTEPSPIRSDDRSDRAREVAA